MDAPIFRRKKKDKECRYWRWPPGKNSSKGLITGDLKEAQLNGQSLIKLSYGTLTTGDIDRKFWP
jgi:hypothetical protein